MAGSIVFGEGNSVGLSTFQFNRIADIIRDAFLPGEEDLCAEVFSPFDEGAMNFISAVLLPADQYLIFCSVIERTYSASKESGHALIGELFWVRIFSAMVRDPRYPK